MRMLITLDEETRKLPIQEAAINVFLTAKSINVDRSPCNLEYDVP